MVAWYCRAIRNVSLIYIRSGFGYLTKIGSSEGLLRRALFEDTGGMYPELITRPDIKVFLPPIGNFTVYICASFPPRRRFDFPADLSLSLWKFFYPPIEPSLSGAADTASILLPGFTFS